MGSTATVKCSSATLAAAMAKNYYKIQITWDADECRWLPIFLLSSCDVYLISSGNDIFIFKKAATFVQDQHANNIGHGSYLISTNGYTWSHSVKEFNSAFKSFQFNVNDTVYVQYDPIDKKLRFSLLKFNNSRIVSYAFNKFMYCTSS